MAMSTARPHVAPLPLPRQAASESERSSVVALTRSAVGLRCYPVVGLPIRCPRRCGYDPCAVKAYELAVDWSTADVIGDRGTLTFSVQLNEEPDSYWRNEFEPVRQRVQQQVGTVPDLWFDAAPAIGTQLSGGGFRPDNVPLVRQTLDDMVELVNTQAANALADAEEKQREEEARAGELRQEAKKATELFRADS